jgi:molybdopterin/thiamine biosynthesis adenylyltransferase
MDKRHLRQSFLGEYSECTIKDSKVAIVGLCGGGSHIAQQLAHIGFCQFNLYDPDHAEDHNCSRMVGLTPIAAEQKTAKTDVIEQLIKGINPNAKVHKFSKNWQEEPEALKECTAIFGCVDNYQARDELEHYARRYLIPYIDIGMDVHGEANNYAITGQVILSLPGHLCMRCMGFITQKRLAEEANRYGNAGPRPQVIWPNGTLASIAVAKFMSILTQWNATIVPALYTEYDGNRLLVFPSNKLIALKEARCGHYAGPNGVGDVTW